MKKILIADDEKEALAILEKKFRENHLLVTAVTNGTDAVKAAKLDKPDLVLLDIAMPDMDGYAVANALKEDESLKDVPVIFITGKELDKSGIQERLSGLGAYDFISKPCSLEEIVEKVRKALFCE